MRPDVGSEKAWRSAWPVSMLAEWVVLETDDTSWLRGRVFRLEEIMSTEHVDDWKPIRVELAGRQWITVLAVLDKFIETKLAPKLQELHKRGAKPSDVPEHLRTVLTGPIIAQGVIVKALHEAGIMTPEANEKLGIDKLMKLAQQYLDRRN